jgi:hypothetical protein
VGPITTTPLIDFTGGSAYPVLGGASGTAGFSFNVTKPTRVSALGFFDVGGDGVTSWRPVSLWTGGGVLLATAYIDNSASVVPSTSSAGNWRAVAITPLILDPGSYVLGTYFLDAYKYYDDQAIFYASPSSIPGVSYVSTCVIGDGVRLSFPECLPPESVASSFGPMAFTSEVPEASTAALSLLGIVLVIVRRVAFRGSRVVWPF